MLAQPVVLFGNSLAVMVAASTLARNGIDVVVINSARGWGGHFTTVNCGGIAFDPGMVLQEFTSFNTEGPAAELDSYDPGIRNDVGRFCHLVQTFVHEYQTTHEIPTPKMEFEGRIVDDFLIANHIESLPDLSIADAVRSELRDGRAAADPELHASRKTRSGAYDALDYHTASIANHGPTFHGSVIELFCTKLMNVSTREILARFHRVAWLPLFYPETLLSYLDGQPQRLPPTRFNYPDGECVGELTHKLRAEIESSKRVTVLRDRVTAISRNAPGQLVVDLSEKGRLTFDQGAWGGAPSELLMALGLDQTAQSYDKCSIVLAFVRIPRKSLRLEFSVLFVLDRRRAVYRVTNQSVCGRLEGEFAHIVVELNPDFAGAAPDAPSGTADWSTVVARDLVELGIGDAAADVAVLETRSMNRALMLPTMRSQNSCRIELEAIRNALPSISLIGSASGFFSTSFNDQVVQGLKLARQWGA